MQGRLQTFGERDAPQPSCEFDQDGFRAQRQRRSQSPTVGWALGPASSEGEEFCGTSGQDRASPTIARRKAGRPYRASVPRVPLREGRGDAHVASGSGAGGFEPEVGAAGAESGVASDHESMRRVAEGDRLAFEELVGRYRHPLYRFILRQVRRPSIAEEVVQETFVRVFEAAGRYEPRGALSTWIFRIAANLCINEAVAARSKHETMVDAPEYACRAPNAVEQLASEEVRAAVEAAFAELPPQQRAAVHLSRFEHMTYAEIATVLNVSVPAVDGLIQRARQALRVRLREFA